MACLGRNNDLILFDVVSGVEVDRVKAFFRPNPLIFEFFLLNASFLTPGKPLVFVGMGFSPDAHYFLAASQGTIYAYDLEKHEPSVSSSVHQDSGFPDVRLRRPRPLGGGKRVPTYARTHFHVSCWREGGEVDLGGGTPTGATHGDYVLVRPVQNFAVGAYDFKAGRGVVSNKNPAFDVYDNLAVREQHDGEPAIYDLESQRQLDRVLADGSLGNLKVATVAPDLKYLAISGTERQRSGTSPTEAGYPRARVHGAWFAPDRNLYVDFPKDEEVAHAIVRVSLDHQALAPSPPITNEFAQQYGPYLLVRKPEKHGFQPGMFGPMEFGLDS